MMEAIISGQAGAYAVISKPIVLYDLDGRRVELSSGEWWSAFRGCTDVRRLKVKSKNEALETCKDLRSKDRALRFTLHLLDGSEDRAELAEAIERLLDTATTAEFVSNSLYVAPLPSTETAIAAQHDFSHLTRLSTLLGGVLSDQVLIGQVRELFDQADVSEFEDEGAYSDFRRRIFQLGFQKELVSLVKEQKSIEFFLLQLNSNFRNITGARRALESWTENFVPSVEICRTTLHLMRGALEIPERSNLSTKGRGILEQIRSQQSAITQRLKSRDVAYARKFAADLIRSQRGVSTEEQIAKSLARRRKKVCQDKWCPGVATGMGGRGRKT